MGQTTDTSSGAGANDSGAWQDHDHEDIKTLARLLDNQFRVPGTKISFGLDAIMGMVPVVGDVAGGAISLYLVAKAVRHGAPMELVMRMIANAGIDLVVGSVPVVGDLFDVAWQANQMNVRILDEHLREVALKRQGNT